MFVLLAVVTVISSFMAFYSRRLSFLFFGIGGFFVLSGILFGSGVELNKVYNTTTVTFIDSNATTITQDFNYYTVNNNNDNGANILAWGSLITAFILIMSPFAFKFDGTGDLIEY